MFDRCIEEIKNVNSHHRIGQAICNALNITCPELYYIKDKEFLEKIKEYTIVIKSTSGDTND